MFWDQLSADQWEAARSTAGKLGLQLFGIELRETPYDYEALRTNSASAMGSHA
jgi:hypothetical protein